MNNKVVFKQLYIQNFKSFGQEVCFDFAKHSGLNYVFGVNKDIPGTSNGVGKSALFESMLFALFGKTLQNTSNQYLANRIITDKKLMTQVTLDFDVSKDSYRVTSFIKNRRAPYIASCRVWKNGLDDEHEVTKSSVPVTREYIEKEILKCNYDLFKNSVILSSSDSYNFFSMNKGQKRTYVENIFNLSVFGQMLKNVRADINNIDKMTLAVNSETKQLKDNISALKEKKALFEDEKKNAIQSIAQKIRTKQSQQQQLKTEMTEQELQEQQQALDQHSNLIAKYNELIDGEMKVTNIIKRLTTDNDYYSKEIEKHSEVLQIVCRDCKTLIENKYSINDIQKNKQDGAAKVKEYSDYLPIMKQKQQLLKEECDKVQLKVKEFDQLKEQMNHNKWVKDHLAKDIKDLADQLKQQIDRQSPFVELIEKYEQQLAQNLQTLDSYFSNRAHLQALEHVVSEDGAKRFIIKDLIKILNNLIRKYLEEMGAEFTCTFDNNFEVSFVTNTGECEFSNFSAGERQRLNISTLLAFRDVLNGCGNFETNVFVLDEILDANIDDYCIQALINILHKQSEEKGQTIFVISHRESVKEEEFDNIIELQKKNSVTTIISDMQGGISEE